MHVHEYLYRNKLLGKGLLSKMSPPDLLCQRFCRERMKHNTLLATSFDGKDWSSYSKIPFSLKSTNHGTLNLVYNEEFKTKNGNIKRILNFREVFPGQCEIHLCFFHLRQTIDRKIEDLGIKRMLNKNDYKLLYSYFYNLAYVPEQFEEETFKNFVIPLIVRSQGFI